MTNNLVQQVREAYLEFLSNTYDEQTAKQWLRDIYKTVTDVSPEDYNREHETAVINEVYSSL